MPGYERCTHICEWKEPHFIYDLLLASFFVRVLTEKSLDMSSHKLHGVFTWRLRLLLLGRCSKEEEWYIGSTWTICVHMSLCLHSDIGINHSKWWLSPYHSNMHGSSNSGHYRLPPRIQVHMCVSCVSKNTFKVSSKDSEFSPKFECNSILTACIHHSTNTTILSKRHPRHKTQ